VIDALRAQRDAEAQVDEDADALYGGDAGGKARRYQARLREKNQVELERGDVVGLDAMEEQADPASEMEFAGGAGGGGQMLAAGLVGVDVELPARGREYRFTTPRGEVEITARAASNGTLLTLGRLGLLAIGVALVLIVGRMVVGLVQRVSRRTVSTVMIIAGASAALVGVLPIAGIAIVVIGVAMKVAARLERRLVPVG
jgi:hypothetical protein